MATEKRRAQLAAYRARAKARALLLGMSPSAALGKPNKGEQSKTELGFNRRTVEGRNTATFAEQIAAPAFLTPAPAGGKKKTKAGNVTSTNTPGTVGRIILNLRDSRTVNVIIETVDPITGARRIIEPWRRGGINAGTLKSMIEDAGGDLIAAVIDAGYSGQAGNTDLDALTSGDGVVNISVSYK